MRKELVIGEWEVDAQGRKFRQFGNSIEYQPVLKTTGSGLIGLSSEEYEALQKRNHEIAERNKRILKGSIEE